MTKINSAFFKGTLRVALDLGIEIEPQLEAIWQQIDPSEPTVMEPEIFELWETLRKEVESKIPEPVDDDEKFTISRCWKSFVGETESSISLKGYAKLARIEQGRDPKLVERQATDTASLREQEMLPAHKCSHRESVRRYKEAHKPRDEESGWLSRGPRPALPVGPREDWVNYENYRLDSWAEPGFTFEDFRAVSVWRTETSEQTVLPLPPSQSPSCRIVTADPFWTRKLDDFLCEPELDPNEIITRINGTSITRTDLSTVVPTDNLHHRDGHLSNTLVNAFCSIVVDKVERATNAAMLPLHTLISASISPATIASDHGLTAETLMQRDLILFPLLVLDGSHWVLVAANGPKKTLTSYNSMEGDETLWSEEVARWLTLALGEDIGREFRLEKGISPVQEDTEDCGVFVCINAMLLAEDTEPESYYSAEHMDTLREYIALTVWQNEMAWELESEW